MKSLADKMTELLQEEKKRKSNDRQYVSGYIDGVLDMYNLSNKHIEEKDHGKTNKVPNTQANKTSST